VEIYSQVVQCERVFSNIVMIGIWLSTSLTAVFEPFSYLVGWVLSILFGKVSKCYYIFSLYQCKDYG